MCSKQVSKKKITILGATGSVGQSTADVILNSPDLFDVYAVTAHKNASLLAETAIKLNAQKAVISDRDQEDSLKALLKGTSITVSSGEQEIEAVSAEPVDLVMAAIMGFAGLRPIISALLQGTNVAIANKEPLVAAGDYIVDIAKKHNAKILPVDSEHNAIFQVFETHNKQSIDKIILTASGGPFLDWSLEDIHAATPEQAVKHPNWTMGQKISIDSATMMNKALEVIEAHYLFDMPADRIDVVIHPESVIHSMVSYEDGSILSQMGESDMRTPIAYALAWPGRMDSGGHKIDFETLTNLTFRKPDFDKFPALSYAYKALDLGQGACVALNASNEVAVAMFLDRQIGFTDILKCVGHAVDVLYPALKNKSPKTVEEIEQLDQTIRDLSMDYIQEGLS